MCPACAATKFHCQHSRHQSPPLPRSCSLLAVTPGLAELVAQYAPLELDGLSQALRASCAQQRHAYSAAAHRSSAPATTSRPQVPAQCYEWCCGRRATDPGVGVCQPVSAAQLEAQRRQSARAAFDLKLRQQAEAFRIKRQMQQEALRQQLQAEAGPEVSYMKLHPSCITDQSGY
jgi:hypothetical protein